MKVVLGLVTPLAFAALFCPQLVRGVELLPDSLFRSIADYFGQAFPDAPALMQMKQEDYLSGHPYLAGKLYTLKANSLLLEVPHRLKESDIIYAIDEFTNQGHFKEAVESRTSPIFRIWQIRARDPTRNTPFSSTLIGLAHIPGYKENRFDWSNPAKFMSPLSTHLARLLIKRPSDDFQEINPPVLYSELRARLGKNFEQNAFVSRVKQEPE